MIMAAAGISFSGALENSLIRITRHRPDGISDRRLPLEKLLVGFRWLRFNVGRLRLLLGTTGSSLDGRLFLFGLNLDICFWFKHRLWRWFGFRGLGNSGRFGFGNDGNRLGCKSGFFNLGRRTLDRRQHLLESLVFMFQRLLFHQGRLGRFFGQERLGELAHDALSPIPSLP